jgi:hypothetical protein
MSVNNDATTRPNAYLVCDRCGQPIPNDSPYHSGRLYGREADWCDDCDFEKRASFARWVASKKAAGTWRGA